MTAVTLKPTAVTSACLIYFLKVLCLLIALHFAGIVQAQETGNQFRVPPHIDQQLWNESTSGMLVNTAGSAVVNLGVTLVILTVGRFTRQLSSGFLSYLSTVILSQGVMRGIDGVRDYYSADSSGDFYAKASLSNVDMFPFSRYLPNKAQFLISLGYFGLKDAVNRLRPKNHQTYSWVYFHDSELNNYAGIVWVPSEQADQFDNTSPGQGYFRVTPQNKAADCERLREESVSLKNAILRLSCTAPDEAFFIHIYPRRHNGENRLFLRPFKNGVAGELYLSPYFYGDGLTSAFITRPLSQSFRNHSDRHFNTTAEAFAETEDQCLNREHQDLANPLHQSTFLLMAALTEFSHQRWQSRPDFFRTLSQELDYAETLEPIASQPDLRIEFFSLESKHLTLVSGGNQGYLSIDRHKSHRHQTIMSLETTMDYRQVRIADLEDLQLQRDALWNEQWQLMFNLFVMVANHLLTEQALKTKPAKYLIECDETPEPARKTGKPITPYEMVVQAGQNGGGEGSGSTGETSGTSSDTPSRNTRSRKQPQSQRDSNDDSGAERDGTPPPKHPDIVGLSLDSDEDLRVIIPVKTRKMRNGKLVVTGIDAETLPRARKRNVEQSVVTSSEQPPARRHSLTKADIEKEEAELENEMFTMFFGSSDSREGTLDPTTKEGSGDSPRTTSRRVHFSHPLETRPEEPNSPPLSPPPSPELTAINAKISSTDFQSSDSEPSPEPESGTPKPKATPPSTSFILTEGLTESPEKTVSTEETGGEQPVPPSPVQVVSADTISPEAAPLPKPSSPKEKMPETYPCPFEGCSDAHGVHKTLPTAKKLRGHINGHINDDFFQAGRTDITMGNRVAAEQKNIACRIGGCNEVCDSVTALGQHLKDKHPVDLDKQPFNPLFTARYDHVRTAIKDHKASLPKKRGRPKKIVATAEPTLKGQAGFTALLKEADDLELKFKGYKASDPLSKMSYSGAGKNYVTRFGDSWICVDCDTSMSGMLFTPEGSGRHFRNIHMEGSQYWCPTAKHTHEGGIRPSFTDDQEYYQHLWSHKPESMTDEHARANGWIPMSDFNPFTPYVLPPLVEQAP